ncbi:phage portal protein [Rathayibacter sp. VKM Ac-2803]|uniref:phage portal protein n=1 Tax=Rathayibacter sp. VKM Ac-2803 TaxID=2609256 RepID=UPI0013595FB6|nr:phage portal protein [Rathayibacter sp. VKM Ac-2803]MWV50072.1 phage portal protein [Rathayibacter sp. VKM Ac-2803]
MEPTELARERLARQRLINGEQKITAKAPAVKTREEYVRGEQKLPYAPPGITEEYQELRSQSVANWMDIAVNAPIQRLRLDSFRTNLGEEADKKIWVGAWQANKMDTRQSLIYQSMMMHGRGVASCWPNAKNKARPIVRPEAYDLLHVEMDPDDPFTPLYVVKLFQIEEFSEASNALILPGGARTQKTVGIVYDDTHVIRFEKGGRGGGNEWQVTLHVSHPMKAVPFALYDYKPDSKGQPWSAIDQLIPQQDAMNTIRFNTLLAMQFSAHRQKIVTGFDPRATDKDGNFLYQKNADGTPKVDANGNAIPILNTPGRASVDRMLAFPGGQTKVFDLQESDLENYVAVYSEFLSNFFAIGQIPPQYQLSKMANLSGDALTGAESTLASLVKGLQLAAGEGNESLAELAWYAMGETQEFLPDSESLWADAEARSFAQIVDAITKLISVDFPKRAAWEMIPGATKTKVDRWIDLAEDEVFANRMAMITRDFTDTTGAAGTPGEVTDGAPTGGDRALPATAGGDGAGNA